MKGIRSFRTATNTATAATSTGAATTLLLPFYRHKYKRDRQSTNLWPKSERIRKLAATQRRRRMLSQIFTGRSNQKKMDDTKNITAAGFYFFKQSAFRSKKSTANSWSKLLEVECRTFSPATDKCIKAEVSVKKKKSCPVTSKPKGGEKMNEGWKICQRASGLNVEPKEKIMIWLDYNEALKYIDFLV